MTTPHQTLALQHNKTVIQCINKERVLSSKRVLSLYHYLTILSTEWTWAGLPFDTIASCLSLRKQDPADLDPSPSLRWYRLIEPLNNPDRGMSRSREAVKFIALLRVYSFIFDYPIRLQRTTPQLCQGGRRCLRMLQPYPAIRIPFLAAAPSIVPSNLILIYDLTVATATPETRKWPVTGTTQQPTGYKDRNMFVYPLLALCATVDLIFT